jgi:hypothetical protein
MVRYQGVRADGMAENAGCASAERRYMKKSITRMLIGSGVLLALALAGVGLRPPIKVKADDEKGCSLETLNGTYMFSATGFIMGGPSAAPYADAGLFTADGRGNGVVRDTANIAGHVSSNRVIPGTYTLDSSCTGRLTASDHSVATDFTLSKDGTRIKGVFSFPPAVVATVSGARQ